MRSPKLAVAVVLVPAALSALACSKPAAPFGELEPHYPVTVLKLQGYEPPAQPAVTPQAGVPILPGLIPPEMQQAAQQAAQQIQQGLQQVLPGILPPGTPPAAAPPAPQQEPRFYGFKILGQTQLSDEDLREEVIDVLGDEDSFETPRGNCFFPGLAFSFARPNQPPVDVLVSITCGKAEAKTFTWPHKDSGFTQDSVKRMSKVYEKLWGPVPPQS